jgi:urease accessory protein
MKETLMTWTTRRPWMHALALLALTLAAGTAFAHTGAAPGAHMHVGFLDGLVHPFTGLDHLMAMLVVGLWSATTMRRWWIPPLVFVQMLLAGAMLGLTGAQLPVVEPMIASSLVVLGLLLGARKQLPLAFGAALTGLFAVFHGWAHGSELTGSTQAWLPLAGMLLSTITLHAMGVFIGLWVRTHNPNWSRIAGAVVAMTGGALLLQLV